MPNWSTLQEELFSYGFYFGGSFLMLTLFALLYLKITPYDELALIRQGSGAAILSFGGTMLGLSLTLAASAIYNSSFLYFVTWGIVAMLVQVGGYFLIVAIIGNVTEQIKLNNLAVGGLIGLTGLVLGIVNAGCLS